MKVFIVGNRGQLGTECSAVFECCTISGGDLPEFDASNREKYRGFLSDFMPDVVVNCAAFTAVDLCETEVESAQKVNGDAPRFLAEWCRDNGAFLIHVSTDYVFDGNRDLPSPYCECDETAPVSVYGKTKLAGELSIAETFDDFAILRTAWLYGPNGKNFLRTMLSLSRAGKSLKVVDDQFGSPTSAETLAKQIRVIAENRATGVFHATSEGFCSWYDLAVTFLTMMNQSFDISPCTTEEYPTPAKRLHNSILENSRLKELDLNIFKNWKDELNAFVEHCCW